VRLGMQGPLGADLRGTVMAREAGREVLHMYRLRAEVERLEDAGKGRTPAWEKAAQALTASERRFAYLKARNALFALETRPPRPAPKDKLTPAQRLAAARKALAAAEAEQKLPPSTGYKPRDVKTYPTTSTGRRLALARWLVDKENP